MIGKFGSAAENTRQNLTLEEDQDQQRKKRQERMQEKEKNQALWSMVNRMKSQRG